MSMEAIPLNMILIKHTTNAMVSLLLTFEEEPGAIPLDMGCTFTEIVAITV
jgi:hypothetical protein